MEKIEQRQENAFLLERLDEILKKYGLKRRRKNHKMHWTLQKKMKKNSSKKEMEKEVVSQMVDFFVTQRVYACVDNKYQFESQMGASIYVREVPSNVISEAFDILLQPNDEKFIFANINGCTPYYLADKNGNEDFKGLWEYLERTRSKEKRLKVLFGGEKTKWILGEEIVLLYKKLRNEVETSGVLEKMKQEIFDLFKEEIQKANNR